MDGKKHEKLLAVESRMKNTKGKRQFLKFASGKEMSPSDAIRAKCYECQAYYEDIASNKDCGVADCPLYPFMPYSSDRSQNANFMRMQRLRAEGKFPAGVVPHGFGKKATEKPEETEQDDDASESDQ